MTLVFLASFASEVDYDCYRDDSPWDGPLDVAEWGPSYATLDPSPEWIAARQAEIEAEQTDIFDEADKPLDFSWHRDDGLERGPGWQVWELRSRGTFYGFMVVRPYNLS